MSPALLALCTLPLVALRGLGCILLPLLVTLAGRRRARHRSRLETAYERYDRVRCVALGRAGAACAV